MKSWWFIVSFVAVAAMGGAVWWLSRDDLADDQERANSDQVVATMNAEDSLLLEERQSAVDQRDAKPWDEYLSIAFNEQLRWAERVEAIKALADYELDSGTIERLYAYLHYRPSEGKEESFYVVANEIMEVFREKRVDPEVYYKELLGLIEDSGAMKVMRDYAIQHITQWHEFGGLEDPEVVRRDDAFVRILDVIDQSENGEDDFVGTGITALQRGMLVGNFVAREEIEQKLNELTLKLARGGDGISLINQVTAIQVASELGLPEGIEISREVLDKASGVQNQSTVLNLSAIAHIGASGTVDDLERLLKFESEKELALAVQTALERIEARTR